MFGFYILTLNPFDFRMSSLNVRVLISKLQIFTHRLSNYIWELEEIENGSHFSVNPGDPQGFLGVPKCIIYVLAFWLCRSCLRSCLLFLNPGATRVCHLFVCVPSISPAGLGLQRLLVGWGRSHSGLCLEQSPQRV